MVPIPGLASPRSRMATSSQLVANATHRRYDRTQAAEKGVTTVPHLRRAWYPRLVWRPVTDDSNKATISIMSTI